MIFIGDVHGKYKQYHRILKEHKDTIQVGDLGVGFRRYMGWGEDDPWYANPRHELMVEQNARFIRGNHDNPEVCRAHSQWIPDGAMEDDIFFLGGAVSIDKAYRMEGYTYWSDEELSYSQLLAIQPLYLSMKPRVMVTHECPEPVAQRMMHRPEKFEFPSVTRQALTTWWEMYQPEIWVFGHWHKSFDEVMNGTRFICLNELEVKEIE